MEIRLIASDADYAEALSEIKRLWGAKSGTAARNKLEVLAMLAHRYERDREPLPDLDPIDAIAFRMEQQGLTRKDLLPVFGTTARISEVLTGKRQLTLPMIRELNAMFGIPLDSLIRPSRPSSAARRRKAASKRHGKRAA